MEAILQLLDNSFAKHVIENCMPRFFGSVVWFAVQAVAVQVGREHPSKEGGTVCANFAVRQTLQYSNPVPLDTRLTPISFFNVETCQTPRRNL